MNKSPNRHPSRYRKACHLKLKDVAYLLDMDEANLSRFEAGIKPNSKANIGYHLIFDMSSSSESNQILKLNNETIIHRCFSLLETLEYLPNTYKNGLRIKGLNNIITKLNLQQEEYGSIK